jgi:hypothetical protein
VLKCACKRIGLSNTFPQPVQEQANLFSRGFVLQRDTDDPVSGVCVPAKEKPSVMENVGAVVLV